MPAVRPRAARTIRRILVAGLVTVLLLVVVGVALNLRLASALTRVDGAFDGLADRPPAAEGTTFLLLGTLAAGRTPTPAVGWLPDRPSLESVMLVHVEPDRRHVVVESFEPDPELVSDLTAGEPNRAVAAVERRTGTRVDHLLALDWAAVQQLADDNGTELSYLPGSPIPLQEHFLQTVLQDTLHWEMVKQPWNLYAAMHTVAGGLAVEEDWSVFSMDLLVLSLRDLRSADIEFRRAPEAPSSISANPAEEPGPVLTVAAH